MDRKQTFKDIGLSLGTLVGEKDEHYGEMMNSTVKYLESVFPNGITVEQYGIVGLHVRTFDKLRRSTHGGHDNAEDWRDIAGYGVQGLAHYEAMKPQKKPFQYSDESIMQITAEKQREAFCKQWKASGKQCHECELGRTANMEYIGCHYFTKLKPDEAIQIMNGGK